MPLDGYIGSCCNKSDVKKERDECEVQETDVESLME